MEHRRARAQVCVPPAPQVGRRVQPRVSVVLRRPLPRKPQGGTYPLRESRELSWDPLCALGDLGEERGKRVSRKGQWLPWPGPCSFLSCVCFCRVRLCKWCGPHSGPTRFCHWLPQSAPGRVSVICHLGWPPSRVLTEALLECLGGGAQVGGQGQRALSGVGLASQPGEGLQREVSPCQGPGCWGYRASNFLQFQALPSDLFLGPWLEEGSSAVSKL